MAAQSCKRRTLKDSKFEFASKEMKRIKDDKPMTKR